MQQVITYSINFLEPSLLEVSIKSSSLLGDLYVSLNAEKEEDFIVKLIFSRELTTSELDELNTIITDHTNYPNTFDYQLDLSRSNQYESISFGRKLLHDWMRKNTLEGMTVKQSLWVFSRFETFTINCDFGVRHVDIFKMFYAGALPTAYYCLLQVDPDPMTESYHWLTQEKIDWFKNQVRAYLGDSMANYIEGLNAP